MSNIEEDIKIVKEFNEKNRFRDCGRLNNAIDNILEGIEENKKSDTLFWGMGRWTRANAELCLIATKGKPKRQSAKVHSVVISKIREHSRKPDEVRDKIVELCGNLPKIELFARQQVEGWDCWGNEV